MKNEVPKNLTQLTDISALEKTVQKILSTAATPDQLEKVRVEYLGRKGVIPLALRNLKDLTTEQKRELGPALNTLRDSLDKQITERQSDVRREELGKVVERETFDVTEPVAPRPLGHLHPTEQVRREVEDIFRSMGFEVVRGQEVDDELNNFELLNIPGHHPARDMYQTFWLKQQEKFKESSVQASNNRLLLRTHTSNMQVRAMRSRKPPFRVVNIGRVYRYEATDKTHDNTFHQIEGFIVDETTSIADLQGVLHTLYETIFGQSLKTRLRPSYFPFTEPSVELDISCTFCTGKGCSVCKKTGWLEAGGAGMIHPNVLKNGGLNPAKYQGFAFGMGLDRITMFKYGIDDLRWLMSGDLRFLEQF